MDLKILSYNLIESFTKTVGDLPLNKLNNNNLDKDIMFYKSLASVFSAKIESEEIDFDEYYKHKQKNNTADTKTCQIIDDLFSAYNFIDKNELNLVNIQKAHVILSSHFLPENQQGRIRPSHMFVINRNDLIEYVATSPELINNELNSLMHDVNLLLNKELNQYEVFYFASLINLTFSKIHPFQDGTGRTARLIEKWFLIKKLGEIAHSVQLEKNYFDNLDLYYKNIRELGLEYKSIDYSKSLNFLLMTVNSI